MIKKVYTGDRVYETDGHSITVYERHEYGLVFLCSIMVSPELPLSTRQELIQIVMEDLYHG
jgi:hypothetical protein